MSEALKKAQVEIVSSKSNRWSWKFSAPGVSIVRFPMPAKHQSLASRIAYYWWFNLASLFLLLRSRPEAILYYESSSAWPVWAYKKFFDRNVAVFVHYHEYFEEEQYKKQMWLERFNHKLELKDIYPVAQWISHTNSDRLGFFAKDSDLSSRNPRLKVFPNFPPESWQSKENFNASSVKPLRLVYVGALSLSSTYLEEVVDWVVRKAGVVTLSLYSHNMHHEARTYLEQNKSPYIKLYLSGIPYQELPLILRQYHVGLIIYKGITKNYQFNAPNKLFEYLACGLDVWYSREMEGVKPYRTFGTFPTIAEIDFRNLNSIDLDKIIDKRNLIKLSSVYTAENAQEEIFCALRQALYGN